ALADDLRRFLRGEPIRARPVGTWERARNWVRRNPAVAGLLTALAVVLIAGFAGVTWHWLRAEDALHESEVAREQAEKSELAEKLQAEATEKALPRADVNLYFHRIGLAHQEWLANNVGRAEKLLDECPPGLRQWEWYYLKRLCHPGLVTIHIPRSITHTALSA